MPRLTACSCTIVNGEGLHLASWMTVSRIAVVARRFTLIDPGRPSMSVVAGMRRRGMARVFSASPLPGACKILVDGTKIGAELNNLQPAKSAHMRKVGSRIAITLALVAMTWTVSSPQVKRSIGNDAPRIQRAAPADATNLAARQRFLEMFARAYFPGRTGQLLIVPREGDLITRPDPDVAYMHGSPWAYDVSIPTDVCWAPR